MLQRSRFTIRITFIPGIFCLLFFSNCATLNHTEHDAIKNIQSLRSSALDDIFVLQDYRAGKNSFVESPERHKDCWTDKEYRYTLLDLKGSGSIRHIWSTRRDGDPYFDMEFYVDGEDVPSIRGTDINLERAMAQYALPVAPANSVPLGNRDFNFYLPIPFQKSIRVDAVQRHDSFGLWFCQMDYRLNDDSLNGARLFSEGQGENLTLSYIGLPQQKRMAPASTLKRETEAFDTVPLKPGELLRVARFSGPGIVRELEMKWPEQSNLRLLVRYEGCDAYAVNSPVDRFFGPFKGVAYFQHAPQHSSCYLPMPFKKSCEILLLNEGHRTAQVSGKAIAEKVSSFSKSWGYFHALHQKTDKTNGHRLHQVMYLRGWGHWLGMTLYKTGHDHGGGDFAVIDGEGDDPAFLHGVNGEDYFTFAWFGKGAHHPYAIAGTNDEGRYRHHYENVYPFHKSLAIEWGAFPDLSPESVSVWYQDSPEDTTIADGAREESSEWDVFGPVPIPFDKDGDAIDDPYAVLPTVEDLDDGQQFECKLIEEKFTAGWMKEWSVGPMLNLTYIGRHKTRIAGEVELGGMGHAFMARKMINSETEGEKAFLFAHDDPIELWLNGNRIYAGGQHFNGFESNTIYLPLKKGANQVVVRLTNYFNRNFNWTGFFLRPKEP